MNHDTLWETHPDNLAFEYRLNNPKSDDLNFCNYYLLLIDTCMNETNLDALKHGIIAGLA